MNKTTLLLTCLVVAVAVTLRSIGVDAFEAEKKEPSIFDRLQVGQSVAITESDGRYEVGFFPKGLPPLSHTVVEIGKDFVTVRDRANVSDTIIPVFSVKAIKFMRLPGK